MSPIASPPHTPHDHDRDDQAGRPAGIGRSVWGRLLVLSGLTGFAIAQPLLDLLGQNPTAFAFYDIEGLDLVWVALGLALVPPLVLWGVGCAVTARNRTAGDVVHLVFVGGLSALVAVQVLKWVVGLTQPAALTVASVGLASAFTFAYARYRPVAEWARYTAVLPALAVALFVFTSPSGDLALGSPGVATGDSDSDLPPVVFVLLDEFPTKTLLDDDDIDEVRFPNLAAFADDATWYRHFTTNAPLSNQAIPAILTGNPPDIVEPIWTEYTDNLFSLLAPSYHLTAFESFTKLCGIDTCVEGPPGTAPTTDPDYRGLADATLDLWTERISLRTDDTQTLDDFTEATATIIPEDLPLLPTGEELRVRPDRQQQFLDALVPDEDPALYFLHLVLPHSPFRFYPDGEVYDVVWTGGSGYPHANDNDQGAALAAFTEQRHILQARYTDTLVGEILDRLKETDLYDDALVIVMADHGTSFIPDTNSRRLTEKANLDAIAYAPLLIKPPHQTEGHIDDANLMGIDVVPTLADILGIEIPWDVDGIPADSPELDERGDQKWIQDLGGSQGLGITFRGAVDFEDHFPTAASRWIAPARPDDYPLAGLLRPLGFDDLVGRSLDDLTGPGAPGGRVAVRGLGRLQRPGDDTPLGWVEGVVDDPPEGGVVVIEINGQVVTASAFLEVPGTEGRFAALLPAGTLGETNDIRVGLMVDGEVTELSIK